MKRFGIQKQIASPRCAVCFSTARFLACFVVWCGTVMVGFSQAPPNDHFTNATVLLGNDVTFSGTLSNATFDDYEPLYQWCGYVIYPYSSVWWSWTATDSSEVVVETLEHSPTNSTAFAAFTGTDFGPLTQLTQLDCNFVDPITNRYLSFLAASGATYYIQVLGDAQSFTFRLRATNAPVILAQPQSTTIPAGSSAWFGVVAGGVPPLHYQWRFEATDLPGQTAPLLLIDSPPPTRAGVYSVVVSNISGVTTSSVANLTLSPIDPRPAFVAAGTTDTNRFSFILQGVPGRRYIIEGSTNLIDWSREAEFYSCCEGNPGVVLLTNTSSVFSITRNSDQKFLRASPLPNPEICIAHLKAIDFAIKLSAIQLRLGPGPDFPVTEAGTTSFFADPIFCPSGGHVFADSYAVNDLIHPPVCVVVPESHFIP